MKRMLSLLLALILLSGCVSFTAAAAAEEPRSALALDLVIIIDESGSMNARDNPSKNDEKGLRHDAAAALIGLCDAKYSRVGIFPVTQKDYTQNGNGVKYINRLYDVGLPGNKANREGIMRMLKNDVNDPTTLYSQNYSGGGITITGEVFLQAVKELKNNDIGNRQVIVILSDDEINYNPNAKHDEAKTQEDKQSFRDAIGIAESSGIMVYSLCFTKSAKAGVRGVDGLLYDAAMETGGDFRMIKDPEEIAGVFKDFFLLMVGSDVVQLESPGSSEGGVLTSSFFVPNESIAELNILIPSDRFTNVNLTNPEGKEVRIDSKSTFQYESSKFMILKILPPAAHATGKWNIRYGSTETRRNATPATINVVFSYDVIPAITSPAPGDMHKNEDTTVEVRFMTPSGGFSTDSTLYGKDALRPDLKISAELTATWTDRDNVQHEKRLPMLSNLQDRFSCSLKLFELFGKDTVKDGDTITLTARLTGVGMDKTTEPVTYTVRNLDPQRTTKQFNNNNNPFLGVVTHDPFTEGNEYYDEKLLPGAEGFDIRAFFTEPDGEEMTFRVEEAVAAGEQKIFDIQEENGKIWATTRDQQTAETLYRTLKVTVTDPDGGKAEMEIPASLLVQREVVKKSYRVRLSTDTLNPGTNGTVTFTAKLYDGEDTHVTDGGKLGKVNMGALQANLVYAKDNNTMPVTIPLTLSGSEWTGSYTFPASEARLQIGSFRPALNGITLGTDPADVGTLSVGTNNAAPQLKAGAEDPAYSATIHDPVTAEAETPAAEFQKDWTVTADLSALVEEPDREELKFSVVEPENGADGVISAKVNAAGVLTLSTSGIDRSGRTTVKVTASDPEGEAYTFTIPVEINNVQEKMQRWRLSAKLTDSTGKYTLEKGAALDKDTTYRVVVSLVDEDGNAVAGYDKLPQVVRLLNTEDLLLHDGSGNVPEGFQWQEEGGRLTGTFATGQNKETFTLTGRATLQGGVISFPMLWAEGFDCTVENKAPEVLKETVEEKGYDKTAQLEIEPFIWRRKNDAATQIDLREIFGDSPTDHLTYAAVRLQDLLDAERDQAAVPEDGSPAAEIVEPATPEEMDARWSALVGKNGTLSRERSMPLTRAQDEAEDVEPHLLTIDNTAEGAGDHSYVLVAEDKDGEKAYVIYRQHVISQKAEVLRLLMWIGLGILALIILQQIVYWLFYRKSWKAAHGNVTTTVNGYSTNQTANFRRGGKGEMKLSDLRVTVGCDPAMAGAISKDIDGVKLRPGTNGSVTIRRTKRPGQSFDVVVGGSSLSSRKRITWAPGATLKIQGKGTYNGKSVEVKRVNNQQPAVRAAAPRANNGRNV